MAELTGTPSDTCPVRRENVNQPALTVRHHRQTSCPSCLSKCQCLRDGEWMEQSASWGTSSGGGQRSDATSWSSVLSFSSNPFALSSHAASN